MRLSRVLLPIVWPLATIFSLGVVMGIAMPRQSDASDAPAPSPSAVGEVALQTPTASPDEATPEVTSGPGENASQSPSATKSPSASVTPPPSSTGSSSPPPSPPPSSCKTLVVGLRYGTFIPLALTNAFPVSMSFDLDDDYDVLRLLGAIQSGIKGTTDVVFLVDDPDAEIAQAAMGEVVDAVRGDRRKLWVVGQKIDNSLWFGSYKSAFAGYKDTSETNVSEDQLTEWRNTNLPCFKPL